MAEAGTIEVPITVIGEDKPTPNGYPHRTVDRRWAHPIPSYRLITKAHQVGSAPTWCARTAW